MQYLTDSFENSMQWQNIIKEVFGYTSRHKRQNSLGPQTSKVDCTWGQDRSFNGMATRNQSVGEHASRRVQNLALSRTSTQNLEDEDYSQVLDKSILP